MISVGAVWDLQECVQDCKQMLSDHEIRVHLQESRIETLWGQVLRFSTLIWKNCRETQFLGKSR